MQRTIRINAAVTEVIPPFKYRGSYSLDVRIGMRLYTRRRSIDFFVCPKRHAPKIPCFGQKQCRLSEVKCNLCCKKVDLQKHVRVLVIMCS